MLNQESGSAEFGPGDTFDSCDSELELMMTIVSCSVDFILLVHYYSCILYIARPHACACKLIVSALE